MIIAFFTLALFLYIAVEILQYKSSEAESLKIVTFDGSNQPYHPSVVHCQTKKFPKPFYLALTPYPIGSVTYRDRWECPCIYHSSDGFIWSQPEGFENPLDDLTDEEIADRSYFSDTHLLVNNDTDELECWYRYRGKRDGVNSEKIFRKVSTDGSVWSERQEVIDLDNVEQKRNFGETVVSPSVLYSNGRYTIWYVNKDKYKKDRKIIRAVWGKNGVWQESEECELLGRSCDPWHLDLQFFDNTYYLTIYELTEVLSIWTSNDGFRFEWVFDALTPKRGTFYWHGLYRGCLVKANDHYWLYFSCDDFSRCRIGVMEGKSIKDLRVCVFKDGERKQSLVEYLSRRYIELPIKRVIGMLYRLKHAIMKLGVFLITARSGGRDTSDV